MLHFEALRPLPTSVKYSRPLGIGQFPSGNSVGGQILIMWTVGRLYGESANNFGESTYDNIPIGESAVELADSGVKLADYTADSSADSAKVAGWVRAFR